jgi:heptosyltransferase-1
VTSFLLVRLGALGDIVHAIPVAAALRRAVPDARLDWLVSSKHREILDLVPVIDRRLTVNDRSDSGGGAPLVAAVRELRRDAHDIAIDLQGLIKSAIIARRPVPPGSSGSPRSIYVSRRRGFCTPTPTIPAARGFTRRARRGTWSRSISGCSGPWG